MSAILGGWRQRFRRRRRRLRLGRGREVGYVDDNLADLTLARWDTNDTLVEPASPEANSEQAKRLS